MYQLLVARDDLQTRSQALLGSIRPFQQISLRNPRFEPAELGFYQVVAWLYGLYYEAGRISFPWLLKQAAVVNPDNNCQLIYHFDALRQLRTYISHNLVLESSHDRGVQTDCQQWFKDQCGSLLPGSDPEWNECLNALLVGAVDFLNSLNNCVRLLEQDAAVIYIIRDWEFRLRRYHPKIDFQRIVEVVSTDIGHQYIDTEKVTNKYFDEWTAQLQSLVGDFDFESEARKRIEHTLIHDAQVPLPVTGKDIITRLKVQPGPVVGQLLRDARIKYEETRCTSSELLDWLESQHYPTNFPIEGIGLAGESN
jgi:hypothetical protein